MYSKPKASQDEAFRIPDNYRGNAFTENSTVPIPPIEPVPPHPTEEAVEEANEPSVTILPAGIGDECHHRKPSPMSAFLPPKLSSSHGGLLGDIGVEELLIVGILVLLSQSDADDDILLLLMLLLFYK